jgi:hypothetical protein
VRRVCGPMEGAPPRSGAVVVVASLVVFETASIAFLVVGGGCVPNGI